MKKFIILLLICIISINSMCQDYNSIQVQIRGYKPNDTIAIDDFLNIGELSIDNNVYVIVGFGLDFIDSGFFKEFKSNSNKLTEEMRIAITDLKKRNMKTTKIFFENIKVKSPQGKIYSGFGILHVLKIK